MIGDSNMINFRRENQQEILLDFIAPTHGIGKIHLYYAGKFVKTMNINLTSDMEVK